MDHDGPLIRWLWPILASVAGAITALSFRPFRQMSSAEVAMSVFVGATFAIFIAPWVNHQIYGDGPVNIRVLGAVYYVMASGSNVLIPLAIKKLSLVFGVKSAEIE